MTRRGERAALPPWADSIGLKTAAESRGWAIRRFRAEFRPPAAGTRRVPARATQRGPGRSNPAPAGRPTNSARDPPSYAPVSLVLRLERGDVRKLDHAGPFPPAFRVACLRCSLRSMAQHNRPLSFSASARNGAPWGPGPHSTESRATEGVLASAAATMVAGIRAARGRPVDLCRALGLNRVPASRNRSPARPAGPTPLTTPSDVSRVGPMVAGWIRTSQARGRVSGSPLHSNCQT